MQAGDARVYEPDRRPLLGRKIAGKSHRELRDLGSLVEDGDQRVAVGEEAAISESS